MMKNFMGSTPRSFFIGWGDRLRGRPRRPALRPVWHAHTVRRHMVLVPPTVIVPPAHRAEEAATAMAWPPAPYQEIPDERNQGSDGSVSLANPGGISYHTLARAARPGAWGPGESSSPLIFPFPRFERLLETYWGIPEEPSPEA